jgi:hypothetical protein
MNARLACVLALTLLAPAGCTPKHSASLSPDAHMNPDVLPAFTGVLRGGLMGIGGETTGWLLEDGDTDTRREVDVTRCLEQAHALQGTLVKVRGPMEVRKYVERGLVPVILAESIERSKGN